MLRKVFSLALYAVFCVHALPPKDEKTHVASWSNHRDRPIVPARLKPEEEVEQTTTTTDEKEESTNAVKTESTESSSSGTPAVLIGFFCVAIAAVGIVGALVVRRARESEDEIDIQVDDKFTLGEIRSTDTISIDRFTDSTRGSDSAYNNLDRMPSEISM